MKKTLAFLALVLLPAAAQAQFYVEGTFGAGRVELDDFRALGLSGDDAAGTWSIGGGYMFNPFLGIEAGYRAFEELEFGSPVSLRADAAGVYVGPVFETYVERFHLNARAGGFAWKSDVTIGGITQKDDGFDAYVGLGVSYAMTPKAFFGLSFTRYRVLDEVDVDAWDLRLKYSF
jgi:OOP family OmpA-OmpF porin